MLDSNTAWPGIEGELLAPATTHEEGPIMDVQFSHAAGNLDRQ
jgi:hypothetical protein